MAFWCGACDLFYVISGGFRCFFLVASSLSRPTQVSTIPALEADPETRNTLARETGQALSGLERWVRGALCHCACCACFACRALSKGIVLGREPGSWSIQMCLQRGSELECYQGFCKDMVEMGGVLFVPPFRLSQKVFQLKKTLCWRSMRYRKLSVDW